MNLPAILDVEAPSQAWDDSNNLACNRTKDTLSEIAVQHRYAANTRLLGSRSLLITLYFVASSLFGFRNLLFNYCLRYT